MVAPRIFCVTNLPSSPAWNVSFSPCFLSGEIPRAGRNKCGIALRALSARRRGDPPLPPQDPACCAAARLTARRNLVAPGRGAKQRSCSPSSPIGLSREQDLAAPRVVPTSPERSRPPARGEPGCGRQSLTRERLLPSTEPAPRRAGTRANEALTHLPSPLRRWRGKDRRPEPRPRAPSAPRRAGRGRGRQPPSGAGGAGRLAASNTFSSELCGSSHKQTNTAKERPLPSDPSLLGSRCLSYWCGGYLFIWFFPPTLPLHAHAHTPSLFFLTPPLPPRPFSPRPQPSQLRSSPRSAPATAPQPAARGGRAAGRRARGGSGGGRVRGRGRATGESGCEAPPAAPRQGAEPGIGRGARQGGSMRGARGVGRYAVRQRGAGTAGHGLPLPLRACAYVLPWSAAPSWLSRRFQARQPQCAWCASLRCSLCDWCGSSFISPFTGYWPFVVTLLLNSLLPPAPTSRGTAGLTCPLLRAVHTLRLSQGKGP